MKIKAYNENKTCWNCPAAIFKGNVDFRACGQSMERIKELKDPDYTIVIECARRPELGHFEPSISFKQCPEWNYREEINCYLLKDMRVMILGLDGYLGWTLGLRLGRLGCKVSGVDNYFRRECVEEKEAFSVVPIASMEERLQAAQEILGVEIAFREIDILDRQKLGGFLEEIRPEAIVHYAECPSAPYSMVDADHAIKVQYNNVIGTLGLLFLMKDIVPETCLIKLGCYDDKTEILTENGWKLFEDLKENDRVATRSKNSRKIIFKKSKSIHEYDYKGKMYYQKNDRLDFCVTPNHRIFTQIRSNTTYKELRLESVQDVEGKRRVYDIGFEWEGLKKDFFILPAVDENTIDKKVPIDLWLDFFGWYIAEGYVGQRTDRPSNYRVTIKQNKFGAHLNTLEKVLSSLSETLNINLTKWEDGDCFVFNLYSKQLASYLDKFGKARDKYIPKEIMQLEKSLLRTLLFSLIKGDGWEHNPDDSRENYRYFSISKQLTDDVQEIALKCGYGAIVSYSDSKEGYCVYICQTPRVHVNHSDPTDSYIDYDGKVWCVNVEGDGIVLVRRNGRPVWSGNTLGEYGAPLTGRPLFEGIFPADAILKYGDREWSLGGELTPRDPVSLYHVCYDEETEVFTRDGWKYFWELEFDDNILTWNLDENCVEYQKPSEIVNYDYQGLMYELKHRKVDLKVTPNHRMIVGNKTRNNGINWKVLEAKEIESLNKFYKVGIPNWDGNEKQTFTIPNAKVATTKKKKKKYYYQEIDAKNLPMDDWLRFFAWFITEGNIYQESFSKYRIQISQDAEDEQELSDLLRLIKRLGYNPNISRHHGKIKSIRIYDSQLGQYLKVFGKSNEKYIPLELKELSKRQLSILLETMIAGDGTEIKSKNKKYWQYYTSSKRLADDVQEIALKVGYSAILRKGKQRSNFPEYVVSISETINTQVNQLHNNDKWMPYNGKIHCCIVDNGTLLVRRNGRPVWSGNSKVQDTFNVYEACKYWWLRSYDVMQGVIYGVQTDEVAADPRLRTRLDADEWFGTVVNRFVIQAILGLPLTVYGQGEQIRGLIALDDAMQCMVRLIASPPEPGQYDVVNQVSGLHKIRKLADSVAKVANDKFGLDVKIQRVENPRVEADFHPFEVISKKLPKTFGFEPKLSLEEEITNMFTLLTQLHIKKRIEDTAHVFWPVTRWDGEKRKSEVIEIYTPGTKQNGGFQPQLDTGNELVVKEMQKEPTSKT